MKPRGGFGFVRFAAASTIPSERTAATQRGHSEFALQPMTELLSDLGKGTRCQSESAPGPTWSSRGPTVSNLTSTSMDRTIDDVIDRIRTHPLNQDTLRVLVDLNDFGNGLQLEAPPGAGLAAVRQVGLSNAGVRLGLIPPDSNQASGSIVGGVDAIVGADYVPRDAGGALDTLLRMQTAVLEGDIPEIERLQKNWTKISIAPAGRGDGSVFGARIWNSCRHSRPRTKSWQIEVSSLDEIDADLATVISELNSAKSRSGSLHEDHRANFATYRFELLVAILSISRHALPDTEFRRASVARSSVHDHSDSTASSTFFGISGHADQHTAFWHFATQCGSAVSLSTGLDWHGDVAAVGIAARPGQPVGCLVAKRSRGDRAIAVISPRAFFYDYRVHVSRRELAVAAHETRSGSLRDDHCFGTRWKTDHESALAHPAESQSAARMSSDHQR